MQRLTFEAEPDRGIVQPGRGSARATDQRGGVVDAVSLDRGEPERTRVAHGCDQQRPARAVGIDDPDGVMVPLAHRRQRRPLGVS